MLLEVFSYMSESFPSGKTASSGFPKPKADPLDFLSLPNRQMRYSIKLQLRMNIWNSGAESLGRKRVLLVCVTKLGPPFPSPVLENSPKPWSTSKTHWKHNVY